MPPLRFGTVSTFMARIDDNPKGCLRKTGGSRTCSRPQRVSARKGQLIPVGAGEPLCRISRQAQPRVYPRGRGGPSDICPEQAFSKVPRVCGGAREARLITPDGEGLSPLVRGSLLTVEPWISDNVKVQGGESIVVSLSFYEQNFICVHDGLGSFSQGLCTQIADRLCVAPDEHQCAMLPFGLLLLCR